MFSSLFRSLSTPHTMQACWKAGDPIFPSTFAAMLKTNVSAAILEGERESELSFLICVRSNVEK